MRRSSARVSYGAMEGTSKDAVPPEMKVATKFECQRATRQDSEKGISQSLTVHPLSGDGPVPFDSRPVNGESTLSKRGERQQYTKRSFEFPTLEGREFGAYQRMEKDGSQRQTTRHE